jgi:hypothetical protein
MERQRCSTDFWLHWRLFFIFIFRREKLEWQLPRGFPIAEETATILTHDKGPFNGVGLRVAMTLNYRNGLCPAIRAKVKTSTPASASRVSAV